MKAHGRLLLARLSSVVICSALTGAGCAATDDAAASLDEADVRVARIEIMGPG